MQKYAQIFVRGHYLFLEALHSLRSRKTVRFSEQIISEDKISEHISRNGRYCLYIRNRSNNRDQIAGNSLLSSEIIPNRGYGSCKTGLLKLTASNAVTTVIALSELYFHLLSLFCYSPRSCQDCYTST